jgi:hypothetical protein
MDTKTKERTDEAATSLPAEREAVVVTDALPTEPHDDGSEEPDVGITEAKDLEDLRARAREAPVLDWGEVKRPWMRKFLNTLAFRPVIAFACRSVKVSDESVRLWREKEPAFDAAVERALRLGRDTVEEAALRRAVDGVPKAIFGKQDQIIGVEMKYSDSLAEMLLKGYQPERFREKQNGPLININVTQTEEALQSALTSGTLERFFGRKLTEKGESP